jgi:RNA polymerase sigma-70 factor (ECF subfamily)
MTTSSQLSQILTLCKAGQAQAFEKLIDLYAKRCYGYFLRASGDAELSEELLSQLFVRLVEKIGTYRGGSFDRWIFETAANIFKDHLRAKRRRQKLLDARRQQLEAEPTKPAKSNDELIDRLGVQLGRLDEDTRQVLALRYYSQLTFKEIAKMRGEPIGTTLAKVHRGLKKLRELMER